MRLRGQTKLIKEAHLALRYLSRVQTTFESGPSLLRAIKKLKRIEASLTEGRYIPGAIE